MPQRSRAWRSARIFAEDLAANRAMGKLGAALIPDGARVMTHCNAGALATAGYGTALGVIRSAVEAGKNISVIADETRPFLQGARLTAWELVQDGIPVHADHRQHGRPSDEPRRGRRGRSSAPTASPPTATSPTRSAPTRSRCSRSATASRSTSPRRSRPSTSRVATARTSRSRSARRGSDRLPRHCAGRPRASRCATRRST